MIGAQCAMPAKVVFSVGLEDTPAPLADKRFVPLYQVIHQGTKGRHFMTYKVRVISVGVLVGASIDHKVREFAIFLDALFLMRHCGPVHLPTRPGLRFLGRSL